MTQQQTIEKKTTVREVIFIVFLMGSFLCYSLYVGLFGTLSVPMMEYYSIDTQAQGMFTMMGSIGGIVSALIFALMGERFHKLRAVAMGMLLLGLGTLAVSYPPPYAGVCVFAAICGFAYTAIDIMGNSAITEYFAKHSSTLLPLLQTAFGAGTMVGPLLIVASYKTDDPSTFTSPFFAFGIFFLIITAGYLISYFQAHSLLPKIQFNDMAEEAKRDPAEIFRDKKTWILLLCHSLFNCLYVAVLTWYPTYFNHQFGLDTNTAAIMLTVFYAGNLGMRIASPPILRKIKPQKLYAIFTVLGALCVIGTVNVPYLPLAIVLTVVSGALLSLDPICLIMVGTAFFPTRKASASSLAVFAYNIGGLIAPTLVGTIALTSGLGLPISIMGVLAIAGGIIMGALGRRYKTELNKGLETMS